MMGGMTSALDRKHRERSELEIGQIMELAEPYAWLEPVYDAGGFGYYDVGGIVKLADPLRDWTSGAQVRAECLATFERLMDVLGNAGWQPVQNFDLILSATVMPFRQTLAGVMVEPSKQGGIALKFRLRLGRAQ